MSVSRRWPALLPALALLACGEPPADFVTDHGVRFYGTSDHAGWVSKAAADDVELTMVRKVTAMEGGRFPHKKVVDCLGRARVTITGPASCGGGRCEGQEMGDGEIELVARKPDGACFQAGHYAHELMHWLQRCVESDVDRAHSDAPSWSLVEEVEATWLDLCTKGFH